MENAHALLTRALPYVKNAPGTDAARLAAEIAAAIAPPERFRMLEPDEVQGWPSEFSVGDKVRVSMSPYDPWNGTVTLLKWFTGDKPGTEPIYEVTDKRGNPHGYSSYWLTKVSA